MGTAVLGHPPQWWSPMARMSATAITGEPEEPPAVSA
jgi:hypothetical protein